MITVTDYWAPWCGPCRTMAPIFQELMDTYNVPESGVEIKKINIEEEPDLTESKGIRSIPTIIFERDGAEVDRRVGIVKRDKLTELIENLKRQ